MERQFVVQIDNRPGSLSHLAHILALRDVNIHHIAAVGCGEAALVLLTVSNDTVTREVLRQSGYSFHEGESLLVQVDDKPGALAETTERLAAAGVNVMSTLVLGRHKGIVDLALTVDDMAKGREAIADLPRPEARTDE